MNLDGFRIGGYTAHIKSYAYGGYWTRDSDGARHRHGRQRELPVQPHQPGGRGRRR